MLQAILSSPTTWGLLGGSIAIFCEFLYRTLEQPWHHYLWLWVPLQTGVGYCVYRLVTTPNTDLIAAFVVFSFSTLFLRVIVAFILGDKVALGSWIALGLIVVARIISTTLR